MREVVELKITHFRFAIGGEHYYGVLHVRAKDERFVDADGKAWRRLGSVDHAHHRTDIQRPLTAKEASYLNKKDGNDSHWGFKRGDLTKRFNDRESIIAAATKLFPTLFDEDDILVIEDEENSHRGVFRALAAPEKIAMFLNGTTDYDTQRQFLDQRGYLTKDAA